MIEAHPDVAANAAVRAVARKLALGGYDDLEVERVVQAVADETGIEGAVLWDVLPELTEVVA